MQFFIDNILLIFVLPLIAMAVAFVGKFFRFSFSRGTVVYSSITSTVIGLVYAVALYCYYHSGVVVEPFEISINWLRLGSLDVSIGILLDSVSTIFLLILMLISVAVQWFSASYMSEDKDFDLFYLLLNLFNFSMTALVLSSNLVQTYLFWEVVGVCSYLFVNYYFQKIQASNSAKRVMIIDRIGDTLFFSGLLILIYFLFNYPIAESGELLSYTAMPEAASDFYVYFSDAGFYLTSMLFFGAALVKSAQFPLHVWLVDAMEAPTPISALIHAATMVSAGIFLCVRLLPLFNLSEMMADTMLYFGLATAFICAFFAVAQTNIKKMLAYSTSSQLGLMFTALGVLAPSATLYYLFTHAFAKALMFLIAGILIKYTSNGSAEYADMKISRKNNPVTALCYFIAILSLSGIFFGGFFAKEILFENLQITNSIAVVGTFCVICFMTAYYLFKSYFMIFEKGIELVKLPKVQQSAVVTMMFIVVFATYFISEDLSFGGFCDAFEILSEPKSVLSLIIISVLGALTAFGVSLKKWESLPPVINGFARNGAFIDRISAFFADFIFDSIAGFTKKIDKHIIDAFVNFQATATKTIAWFVSYSQGGNIQSYLAQSIFVIIVILVFCLIMAIGIGEV